MHGGSCPPNCRATNDILQVIAHMMPDLPNVGWERDIESFTEFFENPAFRTDGLKLYPTLVIRGTGLYELWKAGLYRNYDPSLLVELGRCLHPPDTSHEPEHCGPPVTQSSPPLLLRDACLSLESIHESDPMAQ